MSNQNIGISAAMDDKSLLDSIEKTLNGVEGKFTDFAKTIEGQLGDAGNQAGLNLGNGLANGMNSGLNDAKEKARQFRAEISKSLSEGTFSIDDTQTIKNLQIAKDEAKKLYENAAIGSKEFNEMGKTIGDVDAKLKQLNLKKVNLSGAGLSNLASASQTNATNVSDYTSAMAMGTASIQERMDKLKALKDVQRNLSTSDADYQSRISAVNKEMSNLKKANQEALASGVQLEKGNNKLMQTFENLGRRVLFYFSLGVLTGFVKQLIHIRAQYEILERSMGALLDDMDRGSQIFNEIKARALKSPFTVLQLASSAKQLIAYDFAENQVVETTSRLADISAALGVPMERLVYNLGQIRAQTVLTARDARDFANAGLPIIKKLSDMYTEQEGKVVSTGEVYERLTKRMVSFNDVMKVLVGLTNEGGMFYDFQTKQAQTLQGQLSNLTDAYNIFLNELGKSNQGLLTGGITALRSMFNHWKEINTIINTLVYSFGAYWVAQKVINATIGKGNKALNAQILVGKNAAATDLMRKQALMGLNAEELVQLNTTKAATQADYLAILRKNALTKTQAAWLLIANKGNTTLQAAIAQTGVLTKAETKVALATTKSSAVFKMLEVNLISIFKRMGSFIAANWQMLAIMAVIAAISKAVSALKEHEQKLKEVSDRYKEIQKTVNDTTFDFNVSVRKGDIEEARAKLNELIALAKDKYSIVLSVDTSKMSLAQIQEFYIKLKIQLEKIAAISEDFEKSAADVNLEKPFSKLGDKAQNYFNLISTSVKSIGQQIEQNVKNEGISLTKREKKAVASLNTERQASETQLDYVNRIKKAYSELGLIKQGVSEAEFYQTLLPALGNLGLKVGDYTSVFLKLREGLDDYGDAAERANKKFEKFVKDFSKGHNLMGLTPEQRQFLLEPAINTYAAEQNFSDWAKSDFIKYVNRYFKIKIPVEADKPSLVEANQQFDDWRAGLQDYYDKHPVTVKLNLADASPKSVKQSIKSELEDAVDSKKIAEDIRDAQKKALPSYVLKDLNNPLYSPELKKQIDIYKKDIKSVADEERKITDAIAKARTGFLQEKEIQDILNGGKKGAQERTKAVKEESDAIKKEIDLINNLNSTYEKLTNAGWKQSDVLEYLKKQYTTSADEINKLLAKSGLKQIDLNMFKGTMTPDDIIKLLTGQLKTAKGANKINLEVEINKLTVDAAEYDVTKLTEGLQNSIDNIKEGYELSLDIQANPEMADLFQNIFGLDLSTLPKNIDDAVERIQTDVNAKIKESEKSTGNMLPFLDITKTDIDKWAQDAGLSDGDKNVLVKGLKNAQKTAQDLIKKDFTDTEKAWKELLTKYAEYSVKKQKIDETAQRERLTLISKTGTPAQRKTASELNVIYSTATTDEERKLIEDKMKTLINQISLSNKNVIPLKIAIDNKQAQDAADAAFDAFKQTDEYVKAFSDLNKLGVQSIIEIKKKFEEFKASEKGLSPESLKAIEETVKKLDDNLLQRDPIGTMIRGIKDWKAAKADIASVDREIAKYEEELLEISNARAKVAEAEKAVKAARATGDIQAQFDAQERLNDAISQATEIVGKYGDVELKLKDAQGRRTNATDKEQKAQSDVTDGAEKTVTTISSMILNSQLLKDVMGETGQKVVNAFEKITIAVITATKATGAAAAASNVYLAIAQAILTIADTIYSLVGTEDERLMRDFEELGTEIEWLKKKLQEIESLDFFNINQVSAYLKSLTFGVTSFNSVLAGIPQEMSVLNQKYEKSMKEAVLSANHALAGLTPISMITPITSGIVTSLIRDGKITWHSFFSSLKSIATLGLSDLFTAMGNKKGMRNMRYLQNLYNNELEYSIKLQKILNNADYSELQKSGEAQLALIEKQNKDLQEQIDLQMKRKAKKRDVEKIAELEQEQEELAYKKAMLYANLIKDNYGDIFNDLASGISSALKDAFDNATDPAKAFKDAWKDAIESMIWNMVKVKAIMPLLETWMKGFYKAMGLNEDGSVKEGTVPDLTLTPEEAANLKSEYDKISGQAESIYQGGVDLLKALGITAGSESENLSSLQKGIQNVSETTADAIEGYMNNVMGQSYKHSAQLDTLIAQGEVNMGHSSAILSQLQQSYAMQAAIHQMLSGVLNANGRGFNVYLQS